MRQPVEHKLKTWPVFFAAVRDGSKTFEIRLDDRDFAVGDTLRLQEYDPACEKFTDNEIGALVTYKMTNVTFPAVADGWCVMGFRLLWMVLPGQQPQKGQQ